MSFQYLTVSCICYRYGYISNDIIVVLPAPDSQGFIVTADYGHTPLLVLVAAIEK